MDSEEIETLTDLESALDSGAPLSGLRLQDLDLTAYEERLLARTDVVGLVVLGGRLSPALSAHLGQHHALVFPTDPKAPVDPYRSRLYSPDELYAGLEDHGYDATPDARAYRWTRCGTTPSSPCCARSTTTPSPTRSPSSSPTGPSSGSWAGTPSRAAPPRTPG